MESPHPATSYLDPEHSLHAQAIRNLHNLFPARQRRQPVLDNCLALTAVLSPIELARAYLMLIKGSYPGDGDGVIRAMQSNPALASGVGRFDFRLAMASPIPLISKVGADGWQVAAIPGIETVIVTKCIDGSRLASEYAMTLLIGHALALDELPALMASDELRSEEGRRLCTFHAKPAL